METITPTDLTSGPTRAMRRSLYKFGISRETVKILTFQQAQEMLCTLIVDNMMILKSLPSESAQLIHLHCNYITTEMKQHLLRTLKQDGTVIFIVPQGEHERD